MLAAIAAKGVKEVTYHRDYAGRWFLTLAHGTEESRRRLAAALPLVWPLHDELFRTHPVEATVAEQGVGVDPATVADEVDVVLEQVLSVTGVERPQVPPGRRRSPAAWAATAGTPRPWAGCWPRCRSWPAPTRAGSW